MLKNKKSKNLNTFCGINKKGETMFVEVSVRTYENYTPLIFEVNECNIDNIKKKIFDSIKTTYKYLKKEYKYVTIEDVVLSDKFKTEMKKRGLKIVKPDIKFSFWGWNRLNHIWDESDDMDLELINYICEDVKENDTYI